MRDVRQFNCALQVCNTFGKNFVKVAFMCYRHLTTAMRILPSSGAFQGFIHPTLLTDMTQDALQSS